MAQYGKKDLIDRLSDYLRKGWTNQQVKDLIDSLWRDPWSPRTSGFELAGGGDCGISAEVSMTEINGNPFYGIAFQITPINKRFAFYQYRTILSFHKKYTSEYLSWAAEEGLFAVYYDYDATLKQQTLHWLHNPSHDDYEELFSWVVPIMFIYYDAENNQILYRGNNKHGSLWNPWIHFPWHQTFNSMRETGLQFTDLVADGDGSRDEHAQFGVSAGSCFHEDIYATSTAQASPADFQVWYFNAAGKPRIYNGSVNSLVVNGTLCFNEGGAVVPADDLNFVMYHIFFSNDLQQPFLSVMGQDQYDKVSTATLMIASEVQDVKDKLPHQNLLHIGTLLFQTSASYGNSYKSRVVSQAYGVITDLSVTGDGSKTYPVILVNDEDEPGYNMYYGTDEYGIKGWHSMPREEDEGSGSGSGSGSDSGSGEEPGLVDRYTTDIEFNTTTRKLILKRSGGLPDLEIVIPGGGGDGEHLQSDWNQTDTEAEDYIKNKPEIPDAAYYDHVIEFSFNDVDAGYAQTWDLDVSAEYAYTIKHVYLKTDTGSLTGVNIKIGSTAVSDIDNESVTDTLTKFTASGNNSVSVGNRVTLNTTTGQSNYPCAIIGHVYIERA